jgi:hypothetical protein
MGTYVGRRKIGVVLEGVAEHLGCLGWPSGCWLPFRTVIGRARNMGIWIKQISVG